MDADAQLLFVIALATLAGTFFSVVPLLPGGLFVPAGALVTGLVAGWDELPWWSWVVLVLLLALHVAVDNVAQALGVRRLGGSRSAMLGGAIGVFAGPLLLAFVLGPVALLLGPPTGAVVGTIVGERHARNRVSGIEADPTPPPGYRRLGIGALVAYVVGTATKLGIVACQAALLFVLVR